MTRKAAELVAAVLCGIAGLQALPAQAQPVASTAPSPPAAAPEPVTSSSPAGAATSPPSTLSSPSSDTAATPADAAPPAGSCADPETRVRSLRCFPKLLLHDAGAVLGAPAHWDGRQWTIFSLEVLGVGAVSLADKQVRNQVLPRQGTTGGELAKDFEPLGGWASFAVLGGFYAGGAVADDDKAEGVALDGLISSAIASGVITTSLKYVVGRSRPNAGKGVYSFSPFSNQASFPSGHATQAFAVASVIATEYPSAWVQVAAYGPALLVGFARLRHDAHWASDVIAGALIGIGVGRAVAHLDLPLRARGAAHHAMIVPLFAPHEQGVAVIASFK